MLEIRRILHPTDYSEPANAALVMARALARDYGAELVVCHVTPWPAPAAVEGVLLEAPADTSEADRARLDEVMPDDPTIAVVRHARQGEPSAEILKLADEAGADLIVMGTHGRGGLARVLLGSVAESVMRKARCPVLTVKTPSRTGHAPEPAGVAAAAGRS